jgi:Tfp pilus assembly protein PilO
MEIDKQKTVVIAGVSAAVLMLLAYLLLYQPLMSQLRGAYIEFRGYDKDIRGAYNVIAAAKKIDSKKVFITERALITEEDISVAIAELTGKKKLHDVNFVSITPGDIEKQSDPRFKIMPVSIKTESTFEDIGMFLGLLDDLEDGVVTLRSFKITPNKNNPVKLESAIVLNLYLSSKDAR